MHARRASIQPAQLTLTCSCLCLPAPRSHSATCSQQGVDTDDGATTEPAPRYNSVQVQHTCIKGGISSTRQLLHHGEHVQRRQHFHTAASWLTHKYNNASGTKHTSSTLADRRCFSLPPDPKHLCFIPCATSASSAAAWASTAACAAAAGKPQSRNNEGSAPGHELLPEPVTASRPIEQPTNAQQPTPQCNGIAASMHSNHAAGLAVTEMAGRSAHQQQHSPQHQRHSTQAAQCAPDRYERSFVHVWAGQVKRSMWTTHIQAGQMPTQVHQNTAAPRHMQHKTAAASRCFDVPCSAARLYALWRSIACKVQQGNNETKKKHKVCLSSPGFNSAAATATAAAPVLAADATVR